MVATKLDLLEKSVRSRLPWIDEGMIKQGREYYSTFATEFTVMGSQILVYKLAAHFLGTQGFSEYAVARRTLSLLNPLTLLGMGVALPRYVAFAAGKTTPEKISRYLRAATWCVAVTILVSVALMNIFSGPFSYLFFGNRSYSYLTFPLSCIIVGLGLHAIAYSYFRGLLEMTRANWLQFVNLGIVPLAAFVFFSSSLTKVLTVLGSMTATVALVALLFALNRRPGARCGSEVRELLRYGIPRVPGDFFQMALLALPATLVAHVRGVQEAGFVAFDISVMGMIGAMFTPIGLILLPKASRMFAEGAVKNLKSQVRNIAVVTVVISLALTLGVLLLGPTAIRLYLGPQFHKAGTMLIIIAAGIIPYCLFLVLRNVVDAFHVNAVNARNLFIALIFFGCLSVPAVRFVPGASSMLGALVASVVVLAGLTMLETRRIIA